MITYLPALVVSAACARWRTLGLALPGLWARLKLEIVETETASTGMMATLQLYLERSAKAPLSLDIFVGSTGEIDPRSGEESSSPALKLLLEHTSRWKTVRCLTDRKLSKDPLFLPILEDLAFECPPWVEHPAKVYQCFQYAPKIRTLTSDDLKYNHRWVKPHRLALTSLDVCFRSGHINTLRNLPKLTALRLDLPDWNPFNSYPPRSFPEVKSFTLQLNRDLLIALDAFIFPSLDELIVCRAEAYYGRQLTWPARAFSGFLWRSSCVLTHLSLNGVDISDEDFIGVLQLLPSLTRFEFDDYHSRKKTSSTLEVEESITSFFFSNLTIPDSDSDSVHVRVRVIVPKLQSLSIKTKSTSFDDALFVKMALSRWFPDRTGVASLRSLVLRLFERGVDEDVYRPLFELDQVGMRWGREVKEEVDLRPLENLKRMGMRVVITGNESWVSD